MILRQYATRFGNTNVSNIDTVDEAVSTLSTIVFIDIGY